VAFVSNFKKIVNYVRILGERLKPSKSFIDVKNGMNILDQFVFFKAEVELK
jgi:hypothetical protein